MLTKLRKSIVSSSLSIIPIILIVVLLSIFPINNPIVSLDKNAYIMLFVGMVVLIIGLALFQIGVSSGLSKVGEYMGSSLSIQKRLFIVILFALTLGALITCAEPSILIVSKQVTIVPNNESLNAIVLVGSIAIGVGIFVVIGVLRIIFHKSLKVWYLFFYAITFMLISFIAMDPSKSKLLPFIFDSGGITTGSATVPFILALGAGVAIAKGGKNAQNDSFGLVGMASIGPILTMTIMILIKSDIPDYTYTPASSFSGDIIGNFLNVLLPNSSSLGSMVEVIIALSPILIIFFIYQAIFIKLPKKQIAKLLIGFLYSFVGLSLFLAAVSATMKPMGDFVGRAIGTRFTDQNWVIIVIAFILGLVTILCEPAVHVLTGQMVDISSGQIKKTTVLITLSLGVGVAIALAAIRAIFQFSILYYVIPGYILILALMFVCPDIYVAMAFDSGGTASGPMSTSFILPMIIAVYMVLHGNNPDVYGQAFGVVALIAMTPIIAIQCLGVYQGNKDFWRSRFMRKRIIIDADESQIIHFIKEK